MRVPAVFSALIIAGCLPHGLAQTGVGSNEGSSLEMDAENQIFRFQWWAKSGTTYFLQHSEDLIHWNWVPVVVVGGNAAKEYGFTTTGTKFFARLKFTTAPAADPDGDDFDGDGIGNLAEVQQGSDPLNYYDQPGGLITPAIVILSGDNQSGPAAQSLPKRLTVKVHNAATGVPLDNAPVTFSPTRGTVSRSLARTGSSGRAAVTFTTPETPGVCAIGSFAGSSAVQFTAMVAMGSGAVPSAPANFDSVLNADGSRLLSWTDTSDNEEAFAIWTRAEGGQWLEIGTVAANTTTAVITPDGMLAP